MMNYDDAPDSKELGITIRHEYNERNANTIYSKLEQLISK